MADSNLVQLIKQIAVEAVEAGKPCDYRVGTVVKENPLNIKVSNSIVLEEDFLHLPRNVTDFEMELEIDGTIHNCKVKNRLKKGEKVLMLRKAGGQEYTVVDRVVNDYDSK